LWKYQFEQTSLLNEKTLKNKKLRREAKLLSSGCIYLSSFSTGLYPAQEELVGRYSGIKLYRTAATYLKEGLALQNTRVAIASSKSSSSTSRYFCKADKVLCPEIFWITFNGTPRSTHN
jgi:hypothetical protein